MRTLAVIAALAGFSGAAWAQDDLESKLAKKLESEWLKKADWLTDYDDALEASKKSGKPILGYFSRSYAF